MRISVQGKVCQVGQSRTATVIIDFATRRIPADPLRDFDVEPNEARAASASGVWRISHLFRRAHANFIDVLAKIC
jgi:hypothetical protein